MEVLDEVFAGKDVEEALGGAGNPVKKNNAAAADDSGANVTTNINAQGARGAKKGGAKKLNDSLDKGEGANQQSPPRGKKKDGDASKICDFCGKIDKEFLDSNKLDIHMWKECPFLTACQHCAQIIEIPSLA
jgi:centrosomal protein CEP104